MAGSWGHMVNDDGTFRGDDLLENGGDVKECLEEVYGMVWYLAVQMAHTTDAFGATAPELIEEARQHYKEGWTASPSTVYKNRRV